MSPRASRAQAKLDQRAMTKPGRQEYPSAKDLAAPFVRGALRVSQVGRLTLSFSEVGAARERDAGSVVSRAMTPLEPSIVPDLLHPVPMRRIDPEQTSVAMTLAFAGGTAGGLFHDTLERAPIVASSWEPSGFADDLFLKRFVAEFFRLPGQDQPVFCTSHLVRLLARPPADTATVHYRREILAELARFPELATQLGQLYRR